MTTRKAIIMMIMTTKMTLTMTMMTKMMTKTRRRGRREVAALTLRTHSMTTRIVDTQIQAHPHYRIFLGVI